MDEENGALTGAYYITAEDENMLTHDAVPVVDLSLVYSPVVTHHGDVVSDVRKTYGGGYLLNLGQNTDFGSPTGMHSARTVSEEELRVMRARFLVRRDYYGLYFECLAIPYYERDALLRTYFDGALHQFPENTLKQARRAWRLHLEAVRTAPPPDEWTVEGQLREFKTVLAQERENREMRIRRVGQ